MSKKKEETSLVLRTCFADMTSHGGFQWPSKIGSVVAAPDWMDNPECGHGLHGWLFGQGDAGASNSLSKPDAKWLVVEVVTADIIALGGKVKFPRCIVRHIGDKLSATEYLMANEPRATSVAVIGVTLTGGDDSTLTGGDDSTLTGGYGSALTGGDDSTLCIRKLDGSRYRLHIAYVGEDGIKAGVQYRLNDQNKFEEVE